MKVLLHEIEQNLGLTDHTTCRRAPDGALCPMSRGGFNKFGYKRCVEALVDGQGLRFCDECTDFSRRAYGLRAPSSTLAGDRLTETVH